MGGRSSTFLMDNPHTHGRPSCTGITFLLWTTLMDKLELVQIFSSPSDSLFFLHQLHFITSQYGKKLWKKFMVLNFFIIFTSQECHWRSVTKKRQNFNRKNFFNNLYTMKLNPSLNNIKKLSGLVGLCWILLSLPMPINLWILSKPHYKSKIVLFSPNPWVKPHKLWLEKTWPQVLKCWRIRCLTNSSC